MFSIYEPGTSLVVLYDTGDRKKWVEAVVTTFLRRPSQHKLLARMPEDDPKVVRTFVIETYDVVNTNHVVIGSAHTKLLADLKQWDAKLAMKYGVWVEKNMYGRKFMGIQRATFLIAPDGKIAAAWPKVKVAGHSDEVLEAIKEARKG